MSQKGCGRKLQSNLRYSPGICLDGTRKTMKNVTGQPVFGPIVQPETSLTRSWNANHSAAPFVFRNVKKVCRNTRVDDVMQRNVNELLIQGFCLLLVVRITPYGICLWTPCGHCTTYLLASCMRKPGRSDYNRKFYAIMMRT